MPIVDMSLEELKVYQGRTPCPADFDTYWDSALAEMHALDSNVELIPSEFQAPFAECFDLYFTGAHGARVHAKYLRPKQKTNCPAVLQFHGYSSFCGDWQSKLPYVGAGFCVAALDCRGQGGTSEDVGGVKGTTFHGQFIRGLDDPDPHKLLFRDIFLDTAQLARIVMGFDEVDVSRVGAMGGSQGGALTVACAALEPAVKRLAPMYPFLSDYKRVWEMDLALNAYEELKTYFRYFDPLHERENEVFTKLGYIDIQNLAPRIRGEVLWAVGLMDTTCPPSTQFAAYNKITALKHMVVYPDFGHEDLLTFADKTYQFMLQM